MSIGGPLVEEERASPPSAQSAAASDAQQRWFTVQRMSMGRRTGYFQNDVYVEVSCCYDIVWGVTVWCPTGCALF